MSIDIYRLLNYLRYNTEDMHRGDMVMLYNLLQNMCDFKVFELFTLAFTTIWLEDIDSNCLKLILGNIHLVEEWLTGETPCLGVLQMQ